MRLQRTLRDGNIVTGVGSDWLRVGAVVYRQNLLLTSATAVPGWAPRGWEGLEERDFASVLALCPEVVLLGTGATLRFPHPRLTRLLADAGIGVETMDTPAACRTFNILAAEGRRVAAALIVAAPHPQAVDRTSIDDTP